MQQASELLGSQKGESLPELGQKWASLDTDCSVTKERDLCNYTLQPTKCPMLWLSIMLDAHHALLHCMEMLAGGSWSQCWLPLTYSITEGLSDPCLRKHSKQPKFWQQEHALIRFQAVFHLSIMTCTIAGSERYKTPEVIFVTGN